jgi:hypothetical protein
MRKRYTVRYEIEVIADSAAHAAMVARDTMLDSTERLHVDVHDTYYHDEAEDWFPVEERGWYARFDEGTHLQTCFEWEVLPSS